MRSFNFNFMEGRLEIYRINQVMLECILSELLFEAVNVIALGVSESESSGIA